MQAETPGGGSFLPQNRRARAVLAMLALAEARPVPRTVLIDLLWGSRGRAQGQASLRQCVHELRFCLAEVAGVTLVSDRDSLALRGELWVDAIFVATPALCPSHLADIFRGPLLSDLAGLGEGFDDWRASQQNEIMTRIQARLDSFLCHADSDEMTIHLAETLIAYDPGYEFAWVALARTYRRQGNQKAAENVYFRCVSETCKHLNSRAFDTGKVLAEIARNQVPDDESSATAPTAVFSSRCSKTARAPCAAQGTQACVAVAPTQTIGGGPHDLALCMDWQILSALHRFDDLLFAPIPVHPERDGAPSHLIADGFDFLLEGCVDYSTGEIQALYRLRDLHLKSAIVWSRLLSHRSTGAILSDAACVTALAPQIAAEIRKYRAVMLDSYLDPDPLASELVLRATVAAQRLDRRALLDADEHLTQAIRRGSNLASLFAWASYVQTLLLGQGWSAEQSATQQRIGELADRAISLSPDNASAFSILGHVLAFSQGRLQEGLQMQEKALSKNPALPAAWLFSGLAYSYAGEHKEAINRLEHAKRLSPADDKAYFIETGLGLSRFLYGNTSGALQAAENAVRLNPNFSSSLKVELAASGYLHQDERRPSLLKHLLLLEPSLTVERFLSRTPFTRRADQQRLSEGLSLAGLPR
jgi:DNA-binding SARP family transcriptional activator/tetratricopeptide (TPR) repeat protein